MIQRAARIAAWFAVLVLAVASWTPGEDMVRSGINGKAEHFVAYLLTGLSFALAYRDRSPWEFTVALAFYASVLEMGQWLVPGRHANILDLAAGVLGAFVASISVVVWRRGARTSPYLEL
jgi:VanZ family protein